MMEKDSYESRKADYEKALQINDDDWKSLEEYIHFTLDQQRYEDAYKLSSGAYKRYKENYNIGLSHAKAALKVNRFAESISVLKNIRILPFEHASESKDIYDQALIQESLRMMRRKAYRKAIGLLLHVKEWPENLGVGKPYDVDTRMADYLLARVYMQSGESKQHDQLLGEIVEFTRMNSGKPMINHLFGLLALKVTEGEAAARDLIASWQESGLADNHTIQLVIAFYQDDTTQLSRLRDKHILPPANWDVLESSVNFGN
jgi:tetratricopeptide (TPR) repeat protein